MSTSSSKGLLFIIIDKVILALIVGGGLIFFSMIVDSKIERLRNDLQIQRIVSERQLNSSARVWTAGYDLGMKIKGRLSGTSSSADILHERAKLEDILREEGRFLGIDMVEYARSELIVKFDVTKVNSLIEKHNEGDNDATRQLEEYWEDYAKEVWIPFLNRFEETGVSLVGQD